MPRYFASSPVIAEPGAWSSDAEGGFIFCCLCSSFSAAREFSRSLEIGTLGRNCAGPKTPLVLSVITSIAKAACMEA